MALRAFYLLWHIDLVWRSAVPVAGSTMRLPNTTLTAGRKMIGVAHARVRAGAKFDASRFHPVKLMQGSAAFAVVANTLAARSTLQSRLPIASAISGRAKSSMSR